MPYLLFAVLLYVFAYTHADPDLWGHVRFGLDIWRDGEIAQVDPYSYVTAGTRWINHEWMAELLMGRAYAFGGGAGLVVLKLLLILGTFALLYRHLRQFGTSPWAAALLLLCIIVPIQYSTKAVRPQAFTFLFFTLLLLEMKAAESNKKRTYFTIPFIMAIWVNFHGGLLAGLGILAIWSWSHMALAMIRSRSFSILWKPPISGYIVIALMGLFATLLNPYGYTLLFFLLKTATVPRPEIMDWLPLPLSSDYGMLYLALSLLAVYTLFRSRRPCSIALVIVLAACIALPLSAMRHLPLFALALVVLLAEHWADVTNRLGRSIALPWNKGQPDDATKGRHWLTPLLPLLAIVPILFAIPRLKEVVIDNTHIQGFPQRMMQVLKDAKVQGNLACDFNWGEYLLWHLGPELKVGMDGRRETIYNEVVYRRYLNFADRIGNWQELLTTDPAPEFILLRKDWKTTALLKELPEWEVTQEDDYATLLVRKGSAQAAKLKSTLPNNELDPRKNGGSFP